MELSSGTETEFGGVRNCNPEIKPSHTEPGVQNKALYVKLHIHAVTHKNIRARVLAGASSTAGQGWEFKKKK